MRESAGLPWTGCTSISEADPEYSIPLEYATPWPFSVVLGRLKPWSTAPYPEPCSGPPRDGDCPSAGEDGAGDADALVPLAPDWWAAAVAARVLREGAAVGSVRQPAGSA